MTCEDSRGSACRWEGVDELERGCDPLEPMKVDREQDTKLERLHFY